jgi:stage V sporulation protein B
MSLKKEILKNTFWVYFLTFIGAPFGYFIKILYSNNLSPFEFGLIYSVIGFYSLISIFNDLGFSETLNYYGVKFYEEKKFKELKLSFYYAIFMQTFTAIILSIIIYFSSNFLIENYFNIGTKYLNFLTFFLLFFIFTNLSKPLTIIFNAKQKYFYSQLFGTLQSFLIFIFSIIFIFYELDFIYFGLMWGIPIGILCLIYLFLIRKHFKEFKNIKLEFDLKLYKKLFKYAFQIFLGSGATLLLSRIDVLFITLYVGVIEVGFYEIAFSLATIVALFLSPLNSLVFSYTTKLIEEKENEKMNIFLTQIYRIYLIIGIPIMILFTQFPTEIITFLFGVNYIESSNLLIILSIALFFTLFQGCNYQVLAGLSKIKQRNYLLYIGGILNIILNIILIKLYGVIGAAYSTLFVLGFLAIGSFYLIEKNGIKIRISVSYLFKILFSNFVFFWLILSLKNLLELNIFLEVFLVVLISGLIYLGLIFGFGVLKIKEIKELF